MTRSSKWDASPVTSTDSKTHLPRSITYARVTAWGNAPRMNKPSRSVQHTIDSDDRRSFASTHTHANSDAVTDRSANFWRKLIVKLIDAMFSWNFILIAHLVILSLFFLSGCSTFVTATVGDHTLESGVWLERSVNEPEDEVIRDD